MDCQIASTNLFDKKLIKSRNFIFCLVLINRSYYVLSNIGQVRAKQLSIVSSIDLQTFLVTLGLKCL